MRALTRGGALLALACVTSSCVTGIGRINSYGMHLADARVVVGTHHYSVWVHPRDNTLLVERGLGEGVAAATKESFEHRDTTDPTVYWRAAALAVVGPFGCKIDKVDPVDYRSAWEAAYSCLDGVDIRGLVPSHRAEWRAGLTAPAPS